MMPTVSTIWAVAGVATCLLTVAAHAGDLSTSQASSKVDQEINQAVGQGQSTSSAGDVDAQVKDLEATRTQIDQKRPPTVSLSVSGWVTQEVQFNGKQ